MEHPDLQGMGGMGVSEGARPSPQLPAQGRGLGLGARIPGPLFPHRTSQRARKGVAGSPRMEQEPSGSRQVLGFMAFISCPSVQALGLGVGAGDQAGGINK